ncbi:MAG TPA: PLP-dependent aminotransferase family protein, partial [Streptosporangiaceae bacterium]|nr:PLP-dependent aminotransferase family protein [Streptosporangiaceae bacterium]
LLASRIARLADTGELPAGLRLPPERDLAAALAVSRNTVAAAYQLLRDEGMAESRQGAGTRIVPHRTTPAAVHRANGFFSGLLENSVVDADLSLAAVDCAPQVAAALADPGTVLGSTGPGSTGLGGSDAVTATSGYFPLGLPALRAGLAEQLRRHRGLLCGPDQILITSGVASGLRLVATALLRPGDAVAVEEPGYEKARAIFTACGARVVPCRADEDGLVISALPAGARLVYTTPAHQYPLGGRLPVPRRQALIETARSAGALILEDDYDSEFRYDVAPLPALAGLAPDLVIHLGTTAKTLTPALGVGWLAARRDLVTALATAAVAASERTCEPAQHALAALLASGDLDRHVRRMSREYARRRAAIVAALGGLPAPARLLGGTAGLHVVLELPPGSAAPVAAAAAARGIRVDTLDHYFAGPPAVEGLVLGYGGVTLRQAETACRALCEVVTSII